MPKKFSIFENKDTAGSSKATRKILGIPENNDTHKDSAPVPHDVVTGQEHRTGAQDVATGQGHGAQSPGMDRPAADTSAGAQDRSTGQGHGTRIHGGGTGVSPVILAHDRDTGDTHVIRTRDAGTEPRNRRQGRGTGTGRRDSDRGRESGRGHVHGIQAPESRSKRIELNVTHSTFDQIKKVAATAKISVNEAINQMIGIYLEDKG